jgi:hypothetical protein
LVSGDGCVDQHVGVAGVHAGLVLGARSGGAYVVDQVVCSPWAEGGTSRERRLSAPLQGIADLVGHS